MGKPEWQTANLVDGRTAAGRRIPIKTGVVTLNGVEYFAVAIDDAPPLIVDVEDGKRLAANIYVGLAEKDKRDREQQ
ncbi:hypothetical protein [Amycolatopsis palatopharyngis]|uniref:hypothetical protein n=1 Tax=Amycolatopsis palatopharyngis TaxID=187982 RepID=UPI000E23E438|nr:hypothetical protein [Amycolatopsis palatopharyngis]